MQKEVKKKKKEIAMSNSYSPIGMFLYNYLDLEKVCVIPQHACEHGATLFNKYNKVWITIKLLFMTRDLPL